MCGTLTSDMYFGLICEGACGFLYVCEFLCAWLPVCVTFCVCGHVCGWFTAVDVKVSVAVCPALIDRLWGIVINNL